MNEREQQQQQKKGKKKRVGLLINEGGGGGKKLRHLWRIFDQLVPLVVERNRGLQHVEEVFPSSFRVFFWVCVVSRRSRNEDDEKKDGHSAPIVDEKKTVAKRIEPDKETL